MNTDPNAISKRVISFGWSLALCSIVNALLVVAKEKSKWVSDGMQRITGNHWLTHAAFMVVLFVLLGEGLARMNGGQGPTTALRRLSTIVLMGVLAGAFIILAFYCMAD